MFLRAISWSGHDEGCEKACLTRSAQYALARLTSPSEARVELASHDDAWNGLLKPKLVFLRLCMHHRGGAAQSCGRRIEE